MNLVLVEPHEVAPSGAVTLDDARAVHLTRVLSVTPGSTVRIGLLDGPIGSGLVTSMDDAGVTLDCTFDPVPPPRPRVDLLLAVPRPKVLRRLWAQLAALGVGHVFLTNAARVERNYFDTHVLTEACYRPLLIEGLQQARDTWLPSVSVHRQLKPFIEDDIDARGAADVRLVAHPNEAMSVGETLISAGVGVGTGTGRVLLAVGPEGGWNAFELALLRAHRFQAVGMGQRPLRVDTACVALLALAHAALEPPAHERRDTHS